MDLNDRLNHLTAENNRLRRQLRESRAAWSALLIAYVIGFALGVLYAR